MYFVFVFAFVFKYPNSVYPQMRAWMNQRATVNWPDDQRIERDKTAATAEIRLQPLQV